MVLDNLFSLVGIVVEVCMIVLLLYRRVWRALPVFLVYSVWAFCSDAAGLAITFSSRQQLNFGFYVAITVVDHALQLCVLVELAWSVLRPLRAGLSRCAHCAVAAVILVVSVAIWPFAGTAGLALPSTGWHLLIQMQQTIAILRVLFFLAMAGCSQLLSLGWRDRELQVATGFGFYSLVSLAVAAANAQLHTGAQFQQLYLVVQASFMVSLLYWVFSFAQKEAQRHEFTPKAKEILLSIARSAHVTRIQLADFAGARQGR